MNRVVILSESVELVPEYKLAVDYLEQSGEFDVSFAKSIHVPPSTSCVLIPQDMISGDIAEFIADFRRKNIPCAVITDDKSECNEMALLDQGVQHIIFVDCGEALFRKRVLSLISTASVPSDIGFDLFTQISSADNKAGAFVVRESEFTNIFRFVLRLQDRSGKKAQLAKFMIRQDNGSDFIEPGIFEDAFHILRKSLRRGDIISFYGSMMFAILPNTDAEGGRIAADRVVNTYRAYCYDSMCDLSYEIGEIS